MSNLIAQSEFTGNAIGIDPAGCGCMDCILGNSINEDDTLLVEELLQQHVNEGRPIVNRCNSNLVIFKDRNGKGKMTSIYGGNFKVIEEDKSYYDDDANDDSDHYTIIHPEYCQCDTCEDGITIPADKTEVISPIYDRYEMEGGELVNKTGGVLIISKTFYDELSLVILDTDEVESVSILEA